MFVWSVLRSLRVHLDSGETETLVVDASSRRTSTPNITKGTFILHFDGASSFGGWWGYLGEGVAGYSGSVVGLWVDRDHGLGVTCNATAGPCNITLYPRVSGRYTLRLDLWVRDPCAELGCAPLLTAKYALDPLVKVLRLRVYAGGRLLFDNWGAERLPANSSREYGLVTGGASAYILEYNASGVVCEALVAEKPQPGVIDLDADVLIVCRGVSLTVDEPIVAQLWYNVSLVKQLYWELPGSSPDTLYAFSVWRLELVPDAARVAVWTGLLSPGDVFNVTCTATGCGIERVDEGLIAYWSLDGSLSPTLGRSTGVRCYTSTLATRGPRR